MSTSIIAKQYALALLNNQQENWVQLLSRANQVIEHQEFNELLNNPFTPQEVLIAVLEACTSPNKSAKFLYKILGHNKHICLIPSILKQLRQLEMQKKSQVVIKITTATALPSTQNQSIEAFAKKTIAPNMQPIYDYHVDPSIIAGFILTYADTVLDYSTRSQLSSIKQTITREVV